MRMSTMRHLGALLGDAGQQRLRVTDRGDDVEAIVPQQPAQPLPEQQLILGDHYSHGISAPPSSDHLAGSRPEVFHPVPRPAAAGPAGRCPTGRRRRGRRR